MRSILITGGAGFIGTHLTRMAVGAGHGVTILDNLSPQIHGDQPDYVPPPGAEFLHGDVTSRSNLEQALRGIDTIVHLAAETGTGQSMYEVDRYYRVNVQATATLFDILANQQHGVQNIVLSSSRSVYGEGAYLCHSCDPGGARRYPGPRSPQQLADHRWTPVCPVCSGDISATATREDDKLSPASIYAATKLAQEDLVRVGCGALGIAHAILRFQNVFGEGQSLRNPYTGLLSIFSTRIRLGQTLPIFEDGEETRDFVHVEDVAQAMLRSIEQPIGSGATLNVGSGQPTSIMAVAKLLRDIMGGQVEPHVTGQYRVGDIRHNFADLSQLASTLGLRPAVTVEDGLRRFVRWVQDQPVPEDLLEQANAELKARNLMA
ncbi:NAD-dependent epimerase/dehydratase family protein [Sphingomonas piscis]|nr:NAD-dependent epimerase/dehydratase family protein [Sphingomonas piscis]